MGADLVEIFPDLIRPDPDMTTECFVHRLNNICSRIDTADVVFYLDAETDETKEYVVVLSYSYNVAESQCREELDDNELGILRVSDEYLFRVEGEPNDVEEEIPRRADQGGPI